MCELVIPVSQFLPLVHGAAIKKSSSSISFAKRCVMHFEIVTKKHASAVIVRYGHVYYICLLVSLQSLHICCVIQFKEIKLLDISYMYFLSLGNQVVYCPGI